MEMKSLTHDEMMTELTEACRHRQLHGLQGHDRSPQDLGPDQCLLQGIRRRPSPGSARKWKKEVWKLAPEVSDIFARMESSKKGLPEHQEDPRSARRSSAHIWSMLPDGAVPDYVKLTKYQEFCWRTIGKMVRSAGQAQPEAGAQPAAGAHADAAGGVRRLRMDDHDVGAHNRGGRSACYYGRTVHSRTGHQCGHCADLPDPHGRDPAYSDLCGP